VFAVLASLFIARPALVPASWLHLLAVAYMGQQSPVLSRVQIGWCLVLHLGATCYWLIQWRALYQLLYLHCDWLRLGRRELLVLPLNDISQVVLILLLFVQ